MPKALFLDRDGVINDNSAAYYIFRMEDWHYTPGLFEALKRFQDQGYLIFVVSNQGGIAKGLYTEKEVLMLHRRFVDDGKSYGVEITDFAFCPHHSDIEQCFCRKPNNLLLQKLMAKYHIQVEDSILIGDSRRDIEAGESLGIKSFLIPKNQGLAEICDQILRS